MSDLGVSTWNLFDCILDSGRDLEKLLALIYLVWCSLDIELLLL